MKVVALGEVAEWGSGGTPKRGVAEYFGAGFPWLSIADLNDGVVHNAKESLTPAGIANSSAKVVPPGTLFIAMYGSIGKLGVASREMCTSQAIAFAKPHDDMVDRRYLFHYLLAQRRSLQSLGRGGTQMNIGQADLKAWPIPLPPVNEQRRIAVILDQADELRAKRRCTLALHDDLTQSIFLDMFGDPVINTMTWPLLAFGDVCETRLGKMLDAKQQTGEHARPYLRNANVQWFRFQLDDLLTMDFDESARAMLRLEPGDILICEGGQPGRAAIWQGELDECYFQKALHRARPDSTVAVAEFVIHLLRQIVDRGGLKDHVTSATIAHLTGEKLKQMPVVMPPLELQHEFVRRVEAVRAVRRTAEADQLDELFASLQSRAFAGQL